MIHATIILTEGLCEAIQGAMERSLATGAGTNLTLLMTHIYSNMFIQSRLCECSLEMGWQKQGPFSGWETNRSVLKQVLKSQRRLEVELHYTQLSPLADAQTFATACAICALESTIVDTKYINKLTSINMSVPLHMVTFGTTSLNHWDLLCPHPGEALADGTLLGSSWLPSSLRDVTWSTPNFSMKLWFNTL